VAGIAATLRFTLFWVMLFCLATAVASGLAKLAVDAAIQERVPETVRASAFAHAETLLMLAWVAGAAVGLVPLDGRIGVAFAAAAIVAAAVRAVRVARSLRREILLGRAEPAPARPLRIPPPLEAPAPRRRDRGTPPDRALSPAPARGPAEAAPVVTESPVADDEAPPGFHIFRPSPPDSGVSDPRDGA